MQARQKEFKINTIKRLERDNSELKEFLEASISDTKFFEKKLKELDAKGEYEDRLVEVVKGLGLSHKIANKIFNFIHYEIMVMKKKERADALDQIAELKKLNDNLTRNVFVEDSPALKVMVETAAQQKYIIKAKDKEIAELRALLDWVLPKDWQVTSPDYLVKREEYERVKHDKEAVENALEQAKIELDMLRAKPVMTKKESLSMSYKEIENKIVEWILGNNLNVTNGEVQELVEALNAEKAERCPDMEQLIVDTMVKEQHRNNPDRPDKHKFSSYCSCGHCHMAHLITKAIGKLSTSGEGELEDIAMKFSEEYYHEVNRLSDNRLFEYCRSHKPKELFLKLAHAIKERIG